MTRYALIATAALALMAQAGAGQSGVADNLAVGPTELRLEVGESRPLHAMVTDAAGDPVHDAEVIFLSLAARSVSVSSDGLVTAIRPGSHTILVRVARELADAGGEEPPALEARVRVVVPKPAIASIVFVDPPRRFYQGTTVRLKTAVTDVAEASRDDEVQLSSSDAHIAEVGRFGRVKLMATGSATITARVDRGVGEAAAALSVVVEPNPTASLRLTASTTEARTGEVIHFEATPLDAAGGPVGGAPVEYAFSARTTEHERGEPGSGVMGRDGRFVADLPGEYTIVAISGVHHAQQRVTIRPRNAKREIELVGQGRVSDRGTSDLWVWEGTDGRDYAITGTWGADGQAFMWDVTDPSAIAMIDSIRIDARTVNDIKISEDGRIAVLTREGASNRRNGIVILDVSSPQDGMRILSSYDQNLTGGVHNAFVYDNHVYAVGAGQYYEIINIEDPRNPYRVARFELETPGHAIHDVWVEDGIAYSSNWSDGVVAVDVGGGGQGGSPRNPVMLGSYTHPSGWNHAALPFHSESANRFYLIAGDETVMRGGQPGSPDEPERQAGWVHFVEWDEWDTPHEVARYKVPEGGSHNLWVHDEILYIAYIQYGLRVVDISGELMGDLYRQGREIAYFLPFDPDGYFPNAVFSWGPQYHKGTIFFSDFYSGLWAVRLKPD